MMKALAKLTALGLLIKVTVFFSLVGVSRTVLAFPGTHIVFYGFVLVMVLYLIEATKRLSGWQLVALPVVLTAGFVSIFHALSFMWFPGIVKLMTPFSQSHFEQVEHDTALMLAGYFVGIGLILLVKHCLNRRSFES